MTKLALKSNEFDIIIPHFFVLKSFLHSNLENVIEEFIKKLLVHEIIKFSI